MANAAKFFAGVILGAAIGATVAMVMMSSMYDENRGGLEERISKALDQGRAASKEKEDEMWAKFREQSKLPPSRPSMGFKA